MRIAAKPTEQEIIEGPQAVSFQIANGNVRQSCILQTELPTKALAQKYLLTNWPVIEKMARDALAAGNLEDGQIKLVMAWAVHHERQFSIAGAVMLKDRENILNALREKPLKAYQLMRRANLPNEEACQSLLLKMRDEGLVKFDIHKGLWLIG
jgi:predicted dienelactone hydrolase